MTNNLPSRQILIAEISISNFLQATKGYYDKYSIEHPVIPKNNLTTLGKETLNNHIWHCYLPSSKMGKSHRSINSDEAINLLENVKHIDDIHLISYFKHLPHSYLESNYISITFNNYQNNETTEKLQNAIYIKSILKRAAKNGTIDALVLEKSFSTSLKKGEKITDYIDRKGKHPLISFLGINTRTINSYKGKNSERK